MLGLKLNHVSKRCPLVSDKVYSSFIPKSTIKIWTQQTIDICEQQWLEPVLNDMPNGKMCIYNEFEKWNLRFVAEKNPTATKQVLFSDYKRITEVRYELIISMVWCKTATPPVR